MKNHAGRSPEVSGQHPDATNKVFPKQKNIYVQKKKKLRVINGSLQLMRI